MENGIQVEYRRPVINNPHYVNEVRQIITGNHPQYYPWQVAAETGINNPSQLRIVDAPTYQAYETARAAGNRYWPTGFQIFDVDYKWFGPQGELMRRGWAHRML